MRPHERAIRTTKDLYRVGPATAVAYGCGEFPSLRPFGHSCLPNAIVATVHRVRAAVVATGPIRAGEAVTVNQSVSAFAQSAESRRRVIQRNLGTTCECLACRKGWGDEASMRKLKKSMKGVFSGEPLADYRATEEAAMGVEKDIDRAMAMRCRKVEEVMAALPWDQFQVWRELQRSFVTSLFLMKWHASFEW